MAQLRDFGRTKRGWLGVALIDVGTSHYQQIGIDGQSSASFVNVPEPASAMLGLLGALLLLRRRR